MKRLAVVDLLRRTTAGPESDPSATLDVTEMYPDPEDLWTAGEKSRYAAGYRPPSDSSPPPER